jgi:hypothetical protein
VSTQHCTKTSGTWYVVTEPVSTRRSAGGFVVFREVGDGTWRMLGEADRRPGLSAATARVQAVQDVTGTIAGAGEVYAVVARSEWRVAQRIATG